MSSTTGYLRGHPIFKKDGEWFYVDTGAPTIGNERDCGYCGKENTKEGHDGCLGMLPGVMNACCGHGITNEAYIQFSSGKYLHGEDAINEISRMLARNSNRNKHIKDDVEFLLILVLASFGIPLVLTGCIALLAHFIPPT